MNQGHMPQRENHGLALREDRIHVLRFDVF